MKKVLSLIILVAISTWIFAQTEVEGNQSGMWVADNSPYHVIGDITVPTGEVLIIEAGVEIIFQDHYRLTVLGIINANGTENDIISFTTTNFSSGWDGVSIGKSVTGANTSADGISHFTHCKFQYGMTASNSENLNINGGAVRLIESNAEFDNCLFAGNSSFIGEGMGGAVYCKNTGSQAEVLTKFTNCQFLNNVGYSEGGAVKLTDDQNTQFINCEFQNNRTNYGGGAIMFYSVIGTRVTNSLFIENQTVYDSGGAFKTLGVGNEIFFENCTMVGNNADNGSGGAMALYYGSADFVNCIVYNNSSQYDDDNVYIDAGTGSGTVNYCNIIMPDYNTTGANNIETDPLFVDINNGDYHLQETSPCVDTGTDIGLPYVGDVPDMGCYEFGAVSFINNLISENINIYPNPTNGIINFDKVGNITKVEITDISGKIVKTFSNKNIDISELNSGIYFLKIKTDNETVVTKVIKK